MSLRSVSYKRVTVYPRTSIWLIFCLVAVSAAPLCDMQRRCIGMSISGCTPEGRRAVCITNYCDLPENRSWCKVPSDNVSVPLSQRVEMGSTACQVVDALNADSTVRFNVQDGDAPQAQCGTTTSKPISPLGVQSVATCAQSSIETGQCWSEQKGECSWEIALPMCRRAEPFTATVSQFASISGNGHLRSFDGKEYRFQSSNGTFILLSEGQFQLNVQFSDYGKENQTFVRAVGLNFDGFEVEVVSYPVADTAHVSVLLVDEALPIGMPTPSDSPSVTYLQVNEQLNLFLFSSETGRETVSLSSPRLLLTLTKPAAALHLDAEIEAAIEGPYDGVLSQMSDWQAGVQNSLENNVFKVSTLLGSTAMSHLEPVSETRSEPVSETRSEPVSETRSEPVAENLKTNDGVKDTTPSVAADETASGAVVDDDAMLDVGGKANVDIFNIMPLNNQRRLFGLHN